jgi:Flp pilus assembly CpaF family ATPase
VANRSTIIIGGARGAGKSSLLSAMMFEFPLSQRILTIEDTMELPSGVSE